MKKIFVFSLMVLVGISLFSLNLRADEARTIPHKFVGYTTSTAVAQSRTIYRITGVTTGALGAFGIYNAATLGSATASTIAVEAGEATSGDALPYITFGDDGLILDTGASVIVSGCVVVIEYN